MKIRTASIALGFILAVLGCDSTSRVDCTACRTLTVASAKSDPEAWKGLESDLAAGKCVVIVVRKGESLPVDIKAVLPMATLRTQEVELVFDVDTYLMLQQGRLRTSPDGQRWADIQDFKAQRTLFGFTTSSLSLGLAASHENGVKATVDLTTK